MNYSSGGGNLAGAAFFMTELTPLIAQLSHADAEIRETAWRKLRLYDEDAIEVLIDAFYAGINEVGGVAIITLVSEIGGYEARIFLEDLLQHPIHHDSWKHAVIEGLKFNGWDKTG